MAHVLIVGEDGHTKLAHLRFDGDVCKVEEPSAERPALPWRLLGLAVMAVVSAAGWVLILMAARHFLH